MYIVHVIESFAAGALTALSTLCKHVQEDTRHDVIYSLRAESPVNFCNIFPDSTRFYHVPMRRSVHPWGDMCAYWAIILLLRQLQPDVVHCHSSKAGVLGRLAAAQLGIPSVYTPHGYAFLRTDIPSCLCAVYKGVEYLMARIGQATIACGVQEFALAERLTPKNHAAYLVENSVEVIALPPPARDTSESALLQVAILGRLTAQRAPELFGTVADALRHEAQWTWIGAPADDVASLPSHVRRTGWVDHTKAMTLLDALDVYVQTSLWEGLSYSVLEAMSRGKPVVATDIPANRAIIQHGVNGFLARDAQEFTQYVKMLLSDAALRHGMGEAARAYIGAHHSAAVVYPEYVNIYKAILATRAH
ncbi:MAG: glycosyltransferase [Desulfovibrionaceae bacterium]